MTPEISNQPGPDPIDKPALSVMCDWMAAGKRCALLTIVNIDGKSPRSVGAQMVVSADGEMHGYLTGGCLEGELCLVGQEAIKTGKNKLFRYGKDSPFFDLKLPCGSGVDIYFDQGLDVELVAEAGELIDQRRFFALKSNLETGAADIELLDNDDKDRTQLGSTGTEFVRLCKPGLKLNLYGSGSAAVQIGFFAKQAGIELVFFSADKLTTAEAEKRGLRPRGLKQAGEATTDPWTASVLAFHDHEKEMRLLPQLLKGPEFYIGAIGSNKVALERAENLAEAGVPQSQIERLTPHPGLIPGARSATELGFGIVGEILKTAREAGLVA